MRWDAWRGRSHHIHDRFGALTSFDHMYWNSDNP